jgi:hypothetical protein
MTIFADFYIGLARDDRRGHEQPKLPMAHPRISRETSQAPTVLIGALSRKTELRQVPQGAQRQSRRPPDRLPYLESISIRRRAGKDRQHN